MNTYTEQRRDKLSQRSSGMAGRILRRTGDAAPARRGHELRREYTSFPRFRGLPRYSRFRHSVGVCLITWHFTGSIEQALAALFHDISTPSFAHTVDFLHGDYLRQEYTEGRTAAMITQSAEITALLGKYGVAPNAVTDYHLYPIADNDSPVSPPTGSNTRSAILRATRYAPPPRFRNTTTRCTLPQRPTAFRSLRFKARTSPAPLRATR